MKKFSKLISILLVLCMALALMLSCTPEVTPDEPPNLPVHDYVGKNLIYIIGDGMGFNHIENTKLSAGLSSFGFESGYVGDVTTYSADDAVTDSAASATALATGIKTNNDYVGVNPAKETLKNIMELSKEYGRKTAVVTTDNLSGATPAGFSAHTDRRTHKYGIMDSQSKGGVDLLIGQYELTYNTNKNLFTNKGFAYVESFEDLNTLDKNGKIVANLRDIDTTYADDVTDNVPLKELVAYALDYLTTDNERSFTLMVEGAYIDKHSHDNDIEPMMAALMELNEAAEYILEWASGRDDTVIIFTADHETGGLQVAESVDALTKSLYTSKKHTAANVPLYLFGIETALTTFDNTDIFKMAKSVVTGE